MLACNVFELTHDGYTRIQERRIDSEAIVAELIYQDKVHGMAMKQPIRDKVHRPSVHWVSRAAAWNIADVFRAATPRPASQVQVSRPMEPPKAL
jgi:hypothetical protein